MEYMVDTPRIRAFNPIGLSEINLHILTYIIRKNPDFFCHFSRTFNEALVHEDKLSVLSISNILFMLKCLKHFVYSYKVRYMKPELNTHETSSNLLRFTLYALILDERIILSEDGVFIENMVGLLESIL